MINLPTTGLISGKVWNPNWSSGWVSCWLFVEEDELVDEDDVLSSLTVDFGGDVWTLQSDESKQVSVIESEVEFGRGVCAVSTESNGAA
jgi:hypothetical protein